MEPIAKLLQPFGEIAQTAGYLHDILEDTEQTAASLSRIGFADDVIDAVISVTKLPGEDYQSMIRRASAHRLGRVVKLADNHWNLVRNADLAENDPATAARLRAKYEAAREQLLQDCPDFLAAAVIEWQAEFPIA